MIVLQKVDEQLALEPGGAPSSRPAGSSRPGPSSGPAPSSSPEPSSAPAPSSRPAAVAPAWHTAILVAFLILLAAGGARLQGREKGLPSANAALYLSMIAAEWGLVYYVWKAGLRRKGVTISDLVGGRWRTRGDVLRDFALAGGAWLAWALISSGLAGLSSPGRAAEIGRLLPSTPLDIGLWLALSVTAGFVEEIVFRGYLQRQFAWLTGSCGAAVALQAALFGISHGYQGAAACLRIALYGAMMGGLSLWRRSLRPGIIAHAGTDILAGIFRV